LTILRLVINRVKIPISNVGMIFFTVFKKRKSMPWYNGDYPPSYKNQPVKLRNKAVEIANALLEEGVPEGVAIATGLKRARESFKPKAGKKPSKGTSTKQTSGKPE